MLPSPPDSPLAEYQVRAQRLGRRIAVGLLATLGLGAGSLAWLVTQPTWTNLGGPGSRLPDPAALEAHVRHLSEACRPRDWSHPEGLDRAADHVETHLREAGGRVWSQTFQVRGRTYRNVGATFGPETGSRVVVGAHVDACEDLPAADDNASGIAGLLELARSLGAHPPLSRVDLVAYTLEEPPFFRTQDMGSARHAEALHQEGSPVKAMLALEMIGRFEDAPGSQRYPLSLLGLLYPDRGNFIAVVGRTRDLGLVRTVKRSLRGASPLPVVSINAPRWIPGLDFSDHHPFWDRGVSAVMITDTAFYRNRDYHTERDTADRLDYRRMAQVVQGVEAAVRRLAQP